MEQIKTKQTSHIPRELPRASRIPKEMKQQAQKTTAHAPPQESPEQYATGQIEQSADNTAHRIGHEVSDRGKQLIKKTKRGTDRRSSFSSSESDAYRSVKNSAQSDTRASRRARRNLHSTVKGKQKPAQTATRTAKGTVKMAKKTIKTVLPTVKAGTRTVKTAQQTVKAAAKTAKTTAKTAQTAMRMAKAAAKTAKVIVKAVVATVKTIIAAIAAGGWVAVVIIIVIALLLLIFGSAFGIFFSDEAEDGVSVSQAVVMINTSHKKRIDKKIETLVAAGEYDEINVVYDGDIDGDSNTVNNWMDVLTIFAIKYMGEDVQVFTITPEMADELKNIFFEMNELTARTETTTSETIIIGEDGEGVIETQTMLTIYITVTSLAYEQSAALYGFSEEQMTLANEMMSPAYYTLFAELLGVDLLGGADLTQIISNLPIGTTGSEVVKTALDKIGAPYVLGAKGDTRFDCSGLVYWSIYQIDPNLGAHLYTNAGYQLKYCIDNDFLVGRDEAVAGDLVFWQKPKCTCGKKWREIHHVGIYLGDGMIVDASSSNGHVIVREFFDGATYKVYAFARPYDD